MSDSIQQILNDCADTLVYHGAEVVSIIAHFEGEDKPRTCIKIMGKENRDPWRGKRKKK